MNVVAPLVSAGVFLHSRGWVPATSGNLSVRDGESFRITASGRHKGHLTEADFLRVEADGTTTGGRPSAETALHAGLYRRYPGCGAVLHTHSPHATVLSRVYTAGVQVEGHEIAKAFPGVTTHAGAHVVPVFANDQDIDRLWARVGPSLGDGALPGFLIAGHGLYAWGATVADALRHVEAFEHLFTCVILEATLRSAR